MEEIGESLLPGVPDGTRDFYNNIALASYLVGGALGGVLFGKLSDRIGRTTTMILTILMYSLFTCVTAFSQNWTQLVILRFLVRRLDGPTPTTDDVHVSTQTATLGIVCNQQ